MGENERGDELEYTLSWSTGESIVLEASLAGAMNIFNPGISSDQNHSTSPSDFPKAASQTSLLVARPRQKRNCTVPMPSQISPQTCVAVISFLEAGVFDASVGVKNFLRAALYLGSFEAATIAEKTLSQSLSPE